MQALVIDVDSQGAVARLFVWDDAKQKIIRREAKF